MSALPRPAALALLAAALLAGDSRAQPHVDNPFAGATTYLDPDYQQRVLAAAAAQADPQRAARMRRVAGHPTAVWLDRIAAIAGAGGRRSLAAHLDAALAQRQPGVPLTLLLVVYDLPDRDCAALASNGELPATADGLFRYRHDFVDPIVEVLARPAYAGLRVAVVLEPDSLPNLVTNTSVPACAEALATGVYLDGITYAVQRLHALPNVYLYLDIGHAGWLGWDSNLGPAVALYTRLVRDAGGLDLVDGLVTDTANTTPLVEPYLDPDRQVGGQPVRSAPYFEWNPCLDEASFTARVHAAFVAAGWPASLGLLVDTSRNG